MVTDRYSRQRDIIPPEALSRVRPTVVGVGAIGRQVALQLAAVGVDYLQLIDFDTVEDVNLPTQGYLEQDLHRPKVDATADACDRLRHGIRIDPVNSRYRKSTQVGNVLFVCVDKIDTRRMIFEASTPEVLIDGRMSAEALRVLVAYDPASASHYRTTLFASTEAFTGACTAKSTIYCANVAAGVMLAQFTRWLRKLPVDMDTQLNLLTGEFTAK